MIWCCCCFLPLFWINGLCNYFHHCHFKERINCLSSTFPHKALLPAHFSVILYLDLWRRFAWGVMAGKEWCTGFFVTGSSVFSLLICSLIVISALSEVQEVSVRTLKCDSSHCCLGYFGRRNLLLLFPPQVKLQERRRLFSNDIGNLNISRGTVDTRVLK